MAHEHNARLALIPYVAALLATNFAVSAVAFACLWLVSLRTRDPSFVDSWWALGMVLLAWVTFAQLRLVSDHAISLIGLCTIWGGRLGLFLFLRWREGGADRRYAAMARHAQEKRGMDFAAFSLLIVFAPQMLLQFIVALPVQLGQLTVREELGALGVAGFCLAAFGIIYETVADEQLAAFKRDAANAGKVMDKGLWRYSRHPNYFGELCVWWGVYAIAFEAGVGALSLPGPLLLTFLLTRVSGAPTTEPHLMRTRQDYAAYQRRTSALIPWPPEKA